MVTRNIKANASTQVNGTNIGLEIAGETVVDQINITYVKNQVYFSKNAINGQGYTNLATDGSGRFWYGTGETITVSDVTYYELFTDNMDPQQTAYSTVDTLTAETPIYSITGEVGSEVITQIDTISYRWTSTGYLDYCGAYDDGTLSGDLYVKPTNNSFYVLPQDSDYCIKIYPLEENQDPYATGKVDRNDVRTTEREGGFTYGGVVEGLGVEWTPDEGWYESDIKFFTPTRNVAENDNVVTVYGSEVLNNQLEATQNTSYVKDIVSEETIRPESVTVEYSVTGDTWQQHETILTDPVNFIFNIPKYLYLRFSEDVIITEE